ncbi:hypothetical protein [Burkholderia lata]|uniref:hypothetical protein n=1 Tax=Burkholderia lata (strain ATCC 17760 / DSM 23089 / LMG 22485 / NCIMB 9086 / R18194 / 383) TaxID=482957 RepID=UPI0015826317|nr:hypothetical protein [Burkholderia lata]
MLAVERLEDRQALFEARNPVASVEFGLFHRRKVASGCAVIAREWAIIAQIGAAATRDLHDSTPDACLNAWNMTVEDNRRHAELPDRPDVRDLGGRHAESLAAVPQHCGDAFAC